MTRPLVSLPTVERAFEDNSVQRGGNTFIFDRRALLNVTNSVPQLSKSGARSRRSDMIWCLLNRFQFQRYEKFSFVIAVIHCTIFD